MSKNNPPYINPAMFTKPPPNFKGATQKWHSFKVPHPPSTPTGYNNIQSSTPTPRNYSSQMSPNPIRDYKSKPPPNYFSASSPRNSELLSNPKMRNGKNEARFNNPVGMAQPFNVDVPPPPRPPPLNQNTSHAMQSHTDPNTSFPNNLDEDKTNHYLMMLYRYHNYLNAQHPRNTNSFPLNPSSESFSLPPPLTSFPPPPQPPLPSLPPPIKPPPPPTPATASPSTSMTMQNHHMGNYSNQMSPYSMYGHSYPKTHNNYKRKFEGNDAHKKAQKKKKKPLSQVVPQRRDWTVEDAKRALDVEKDCNKRSKRQGLIIKFPDIELNRDIVTNFHSGIESVHFQQPSTPRYCFVTIRESADPETVINQLNKIPFGTGYLCAEYKKDREDEQNIRPTDIDPLTLYVGNLAQEITKDDMMKTYPKQKRIDIGYAKKMKYTRYAFVSFHTVDDAIEAFQNTHSSQMYSKSLIVRFRRLHGTVGMPGEPKQQTPQPTESESTVSVSDSGNNSVNDDQESDKEHNPWDIDISQWENDYHEAKCKRSDTATSEDDDDEEIEVKPLVSTIFRTNFRPGSLEEAIARHRPIVVIKEQKEDDGYEDNREESGRLEEDEHSATWQSDYQSENEESHNEESRNEESHNEESRNEESRNEESRNEESRNEESRNEESRNEESRNEESRNEESRNEESHNEESRNEESHNEESHNEESPNEESPVTNNGNQDQPSAAEVQTVVANIKQETTDNYVAQSSSTSYEHLRILHRRIQAGLMSFPLNKSRNAVVEFKQEEQDIKQEDDDDPGGSSNVQDGDRLVSPEGECLNNNSAVPENSDLNIEKETDNQKQVVPDDSVNGKSSANNERDKSKETSNKDANEKSDKGSGWINIRKN